MPLAYAVINVKPDRVEGVKAGKGGGFELLLLKMFKCPTVERKKNTIK